MRTVRHALLSAAAVSVAVVLSACSTTTAADTGTSTPKKRPSLSDSKEATKKAKKKARDAVEDTVVGQLPDMTGKNLQEAQDGVQAAGFYILGSEDASGAGRLQVWDRNWTVCSQDPAAGRVDLAATVTFHVVKDSESC